MGATMGQGTHVTLRSLRRRWPLTEDQSAPLTVSDLVYSKPLRPDLRGFMASGL